MPTVALIGAFDSGTTEVFDAAVGSHVVANPQGRVALRTGTLRMPDQGLAGLADLAGSAKIVPSELTLWDYPDNALDAGGATAAAWVGHLRGADALLAVIRLQGGESVDAFDALTAQLRDELVLLDLMVLEGAIERAAQGAATGPRADRRDQAARHATLERVRTTLEVRSSPAAALPPDDDLNAVRDLALLAVKPLAVALNVVDAAVPDALASLAAAGRPEWCVVAGDTEAQLPALDEPDAEAFRSDLQLTTSAAGRVAQAVLAAAGLVRFYTANAAAATAWLARRGTTAIEAAGIVHSDMATGFVRADVAPLDDLLEAGGSAELRDQGRLPRVGRDYEVADDDVLTIHFTRPTR